MHVLINGWFIGQETAGSGQYLHHMLRHLPLFAPQHRYTLLISPGSAKALQSDKRSWDGVTVATHNLPPLPRQLTKLWWEQVTMPVAAQRLDADILWTPYWAAPYWQPRPVVVTIHDLIPRLLAGYQGGLMQKLYRSLVSISARRADAVIAVSQASARDIITHLQIPATRVHVVHHGPNQADTTKAETEEYETAQLTAARQRYDLPARYFLYLGGFDVRKNVPGIIEAYARYLQKGGDPSIKLVIAGQLPAVDSDFTPDPKKIAAEVDLHQQIHFCGWVAEPDKPILYHLATAYLFPSHYEGFGMMLLEAMQAGAPVITSGKPAGKNNNPSP